MRHIVNGQLVHRDVMQNGMGSGTEPRENGPHRASDMGKPSMTRDLLCVAERSGDVWEAICLDLDIAVTGRTLEEAKRALGEAIRSYIDTVREEPDAATRHALLNRRVPWHVRIGYMLRVRLHALRNGGRNDGSDSTYVVPCHA